MNICGCLVHVAPDRAAAAAAVIAATSGAEVHAAEEDGRFVVVVEDTAGRFASETIMDLHQIPGVISVALTYHHFEEQGPTPSQTPSVTSDQPNAGDPIHDMF